MEPTPPDANATPDFHVGQRVLVIGATAHSGKWGVVIGFVRREETLYAVKLDDGSWADVTSINLESYPNT